MFLLPPRAIPHFDSERDFRANPCWAACVGPEVELLIKGSPQMNVWNSSNTFRGAKCVRSITNSNHEIIAGLTCTTMWSICTGPDLQLTGLCLNTEPCVFSQYWTEKNKDDTYTMHRTKSYFDFKEKQILHLSCFHSLKWNPICWAENLL